MINFFAKRLNKKGFTLAELLIVVAIIAVLVAVAMPIFMGSLEKARYATHQANARSLKGMAIAELLGSPEFAGQKIEDNTVWMAIGSYDYTNEKFDLKSITKYTSGKAGMWISDATDAPTDTSTCTQINNANLKTVGRMATSGVVHFIIIFTGDEVKPTIS